MCRREKDGCAGKEIYRCASDCVRFLFFVRQNKKMTAAKFLFLFQPAGDQSERNFGEKKFPELSVLPVEEKRSGRCLDETIRGLQMSILKAFGPRMANAVLKVALLAGRCCRCRRCCARTNAHLKAKSL